jgi:hypothetical protein
VAARAVGSGPGGLVTLPVAGPVCRGGLRTGRTRGRAQLPVPDHHPQPHALAGLGRSSARPIAAHGRSRRGGQQRRRLVQLRLGRR